MAVKQRLDKLMVERGLVSSRERAQALIMAGQVVVGDHAVSKAGQQISIDSEIRIKGEQLPYVSRGGLKLKKALDYFGVDAQGLVAIDVGASTGGFTDCLLQSGTSKVFAVDVGYGQLAWKLQQDPRVVSMEKTNIRYLEPQQLGQVPDIAVIDASFISLSKILPAVINLIRPGGTILALIKPQFEVGRGEVGKGGIVRDQNARDKAVDAVRINAEGLGLVVSGVCESPITGADGNVEYLIRLDLPEVLSREAGVESCLFCRIVDGQIPAKKVYEDDDLIVIEDIAPQASLHLLLIPKKHIVNAMDLTAADDGLIGQLFRRAAAIATEQGYADSGFRLVQNSGAGAGQSVFHIHFHLLAGRDFSWPPG